MSEEEFDKKNRKRFRVDMSEVDFTKIIISIPNWSKLPSNIIKNEHLMKNVECTSIFLKYIARSRIII